MYKNVLLIIFVGLAINASAQYPGFSAVADLARFRSTFSTVAQNTQSIKSDFVQEKNLSMLSEKIVSKGKFWFKKENQVRMEYVHPFQYLMILNKDKVYVKDGQKENKVSTRSNKAFQQVNKIMVDCMQGTALNNPDFKTRIFENKSASLIELTPLTKSLREMFRNIIVTVDNKDFSVSSIQMHEPSGDNTLIRFSNKELNTNIPDALFIIR